MNRRDQCAFLLHFTGCCSAKSPHGRAGSVRKKARSSRAAFQMPNDRRLSACGSATVISLRLRSRRLYASASLSRSPNRRPKP